ncbi:MAG: CapA family protein [Clostridiaceae bacterium]|nr:CapA family protein [Clostridiaceae bacterium]
MKHNIVIIALICMLFMSSCAQNGQQTSNTGSDLPEGTPVSGQIAPEIMPLPSPETTPVPTPEPTPEPPKTAVLMSAGDCVLHKLFQDSAYIPGEGRYDFYSIFSPIEKYLAESDVSIISFESAATNNRKDYTGYPLFNCPPEIFDTFKAVGFDIVNNSNNHQLDRKLTGMFETRDNIKSRGLDVLGVYDGEEQRYLVKEVNGIRIGIMAYTYSCNMNELALTEEQRYKHLALIDRERIQKELADMEENVDVSVVCMHWGVEYRQQPTEEQKQLARDMISWGADVILGSHPHVVEPSEMIEHNGEQKYVIYSMGNFVSNQRRGASGYPLTNKERAEDSMLVKVVFEKNSETGKTIIKEVTHIPTWLWRYNENGIYRFRIIPVPYKDFYQDNEYSDDVLSEAYQSYDRTMSLVKDYRHEEP